MGRSLLHLFFVFHTFLSIVSLPSHPKELRRVKRITNGDVAQNGQFPYTVSFQFATVEKLGELKFRHFCGGSLIAPNWILSAAHCFSTLKNVSIFAQIGGLNLSEAASERFKVDKVFLQGFNPYTLINDIALVKISIPENNIYNHTIVSIADETNVEEKCLINGYGALEMNGKSSEILYFGEVHEISFEECEKKVGRIVAPQEGSGQFCAFGRVDACNGDSGSGLLCQTNNFESKFGELKLRGISSHGMGCGGMPGIYTDVLHYRDWIQFTITNELN